MKFDLTSIDEIIKESKNVSYNFSDDTLKAVNLEYSKSLMDESYYKILTATARLYPDAQFLELGTNTGASAVAYLYGKPNVPIYTYDVIKDSRWFIHDGLSDKCIFKQESATDCKYDLKKIDIIFLDMNHDAVMEDKAMLNLHNQGLLKGCLVILDDIHINSDMDNWWNNLALGQIEKVDITRAGHASGTGILIFE